MATWAERNAVFCVKLRRMQAIAERIAQSRLDRAREACRLAGLDPSLLGIHPHNALVGLQHGAPWAGVDYHHVRRSLWLQRRAHEGHDLVRQWYRREFPHV